MSDLFNETSVVINDQTYRFAFTFRILEELMQKFNVDKQGFFDLLAEDKLTDKQEIELVWACINKHHKEVDTDFIKDIENFGEVQFAALMAIKKFREVPQIMNLLPESEKKSQS